MGYSQIAFTFDAQDFHNQIATILTDESQPDLAELQKITRQHITSLDGHSNDALDYMRFDPEWFEIESIEDSLGQLYLILLASNLMPCPSISEDHQNNLLTTKMILQYYGWSGRDSDRLIYGDKLSDMFSYFLPHIHDAEAMRVIHNHGGWLSYQEIVLLLERLEPIAPKIAVDSAKIVGRYWSQRSVKLSDKMTKNVIEVYERIVAMLTIAVERDKDLYLIVD